MSSNILFINAFIKKAEIRDSDAGAFVRVHVVSDYAEHILTAMTWEDPGPSVHKADMDGELPAGNMIVTPVPEALSKNEIQFPFGSAHSFSLVNVTKKEVTKREIRFVVDSMHPSAATLVWDFKSALKATASTVKLSYSPQESLPV